MPTQGKDTKNSGAKSTSRSADKTKSTGKSEGRDSKMNSSKK